METLENVLYKFKIAKENREDNDFMSRLEEAYKYACPRRYNQKADPTSEIYDNTAIYAVQSRVASNHEALFPAFREWIAEEPVGTYDKADELSLKQQISKRCKNAHRAIELSNFHTEIEDTLTDALFSDGAILVFKGTPEMPLKFEVPAWDSFYTLDDMNGEPNNNFLARKLTVKEIKYKWPKANLSNLPETNEKKEVIDGYTYDESTQKYTYSVILNNERIFASEEKSSPWVIFNQRKRIRKTAGWGQVLDSMGDIRTTNLVKEYLLKNAAFAIGGIWQADDDGVLNPDNIKLEPGIIIPKAVGSQGLQNLYTNVNMDLTQFVLRDMTDGIKKNVQGSALPEFTQGIRTASEYQMRDAEMKKIELPLMLQLAQGAKRLMRRIFYILESNDMKTSALYCEKLTDSNNKRIATTFTSPLIRMQEEIQSRNGLQVIAAMANIFAKRAYDVIDVDGVIKDFYLASNFNPKRILNENEIERKRQNDNNEAIQLAQAGVRQQTPTPGNISL